MTPFFLSKQRSAALAWSLWGFSLLICMSNSPFSGTIETHPDDLSKEEKVTDASGVYEKPRGTSLYSAGGRSAKTRDSV
jgi:hypothetical protein